MVGRIGDSLRVGRIGALMGNAQLLRLEADEAELQITLDQPPPAKLPLTLLLALPRPKMLRRVLQTVASMGVPRVVLVNSYRVEKSFWQTPFLEPEAVREQLILGLEQARDTVLPEIIIGKQRNGPIGTVRLTFIGEYTRFENFAAPGSY